MGIESSFNTTCTIYRRELTETEDRWGQDTGEYSYGDVVASDLPCRIEALSFDILDDTREHVAVTHRAFLPAGQDIQHTDRLVDADSVTYEVDRANKTPGGVSDSHVEALLLEVR